jgi:hypothetical protein
MQTLKLYARAALNRLQMFLALFGVKTWGDWRALIHAATPLAVGVLLHAHAVSGNKAALLGALIVAATSPALAAINSLTGFRTWFYGLTVPLQLFLVGWGFFTNDQASAIIAVVTALLSSGVAAANTPTSR